MFKLKLPLLALILSSSALAAPDAVELRKGATEIRNNAINLYVSSEFMGIESQESVLPILANAILALEQTIDRAELADTHLSDHSDDLFLLEFTRACSKIAIARARLYRAKVMLIKDPSDTIMPEDLEELREDIVGLRDAVDCPS